jgi:hypothetical protein
VFDIGSSWQWKVWCCTSRPAGEDLVRVAQLVHVGGDRFAEGGVPL